MASGTDLGSGDLLGALHGWASTARVCGQSTAAADGARHVDRLIDLLWNGIDPE